MKFKSQLKNGMASALICTSLMLSAPAHADTMGGWMQIVGSSIGGIMTLLNTPTAVQQLGINVDAAQLALEISILNAMKDVTNEWDPEPKESYQSAAKNNDDGAKTSMSCVTKEGCLDFEAQSLTAVGIEAFNLGTLSSITGGRSTVISGLSKMTPNATNLLSRDTTSQQTLDTILINQDVNYQNISTAGVTRALLGLKTSYQASVDASGTAVSDTEGEQGGSVDFVEDGDFIQNQSLTQLPGSVTSTAQAMSVQALMNMELAQRINLSNALQSNILSIEAARGLRNAGIRRNN